jgi:hypothetical protein
LILTAHHPALSAIRNAEEVYVVVDVAVAVIVHSVADAVSAQAGEG